MVSLYEHLDEKSRAAFDSIGKSDSTKYSVSGPKGKGKKEFTSEQISAYIIQKQSEGDFKSETERINYAKDIAEKTTTRKLEEMEFLSNSKKLRYRYGSHTDSNFVPKEDYYSYRETYKNSKGEIKHEKKSFYDWAQSREIQESGKVKIEYDGAGLDHVYTNSIRAKKIREAVDNALEKNWPDYKEVLELYKKNKNLDNPSLEEKTNSLEGKVSQQNADMQNLTGKEESQARKYLQQQSELKKKTNESSRRSMNSLYDKKQFLAKKDDSFVEDAEVISETKYSPLNKVNNSESCYKKEFTSEDGKINITIEHGSNEKGSSDRNHGWKYNWENFKKYFTGKDKIDSSGEQVDNETSVDKPKVVTPERMNKQNGLEKITSSFKNGILAGFAGAVDPVGYVVSHSDLDFSGKGFSNEDSVDTFYSSAYKKNFSPSEDKVDRKNYSARFMGQLTGSIAGIAGLVGTYTLLSPLLALAIPTGFAGYGITKGIMKYFNRNKEVPEKATFSNGFKFGWSKGTNPLYSLFHRGEAHLTGRGYENSSRDTTIKENSENIGRNFSSVLGNTLGTIFGGATSIFSLGYVPYKTAKEETKRLRAAA